MKCLTYCHLFLYIKIYTQEEIPMKKQQTQVVHELEELLHLKTEQINKYGQILAPNQVINIGIK